jgi:hypothetical protein
VVGTVLKEQSCRDTKGATNKGLSATKRFDELLGESARSLSGARMWNTPPPSALLIASESLCRMGLFFYVDVQ